MNSLKEPIYFKRIHSDAVMPTRAHADDAGLDLSACESRTIEPMSRAVVDTGVTAAIPVGMAGQVCSRSGNAAKLGLFVLNAPGIIDSSYRDAIKVILFNTGTEPLEIKVGQRIAQLLITPVVIDTVFELTGDEQLPAPASSRNLGGLGSTDIKA